MLQNLQQGENTQAAMMSNTMVSEQLHSPSAQHHVPAAQPNPYGAFNEQKSSLAKVSISDVLLACMKLNEIVL